MTGLLQDLRHTARSLARSPGFTAVAVATLALGIGATSTMFGVVDALFLSPPAGVQDADELRRIYIVRRAGNIRTPDGGRGSYVDYEALRIARGFSTVATFGSVSDVDHGLGEEAEQVKGQMVSREFFDLLGVRPALGRFFLADEDTDAAARAVVLSHAFWRSEFGGDPDVLGESLLLNGEYATVVGVAQEGFSGTETTAVDVWVPAAAAAPLGLAFEGWRTQPMAAMLSFLGRLTEAAAPERAVRSAATALRHAAEEAPGLDPEPDVMLGPLNTARGPKRSDPASVALWLSFAVGLVLLIATANVANLLLARATRRSREVAIRLALGVSRLRLIRQFLTESVALALLGGAAAVLAALWGAELVRQFPLPPAAARIDPRMLGFTFAVALVTGVVFGLAPALQAIRTDVVTGLKDGNPSGGPRRGRLRAALVTTQVTLAFVALVGAGLFVRSFDRVLSIDAGVDLRQVAVVSVDLDKAGYDTVGQQTFYDQALERLRALPAVERASIARFTPFSGFAMAIGFSVPGREDVEIDGPGPYVNYVGEDYFRTVGVPIIEGRGFDPRDRAGAPAVVILNEAMARVVAPEGGAVGRCLAILEQVAEGGCTEIVGVARDRRHRLLDEDIVPYILLPLRQHPSMASWATPGLLVRTEGEPGAVLGALRSVVHGLGTDLPFVSAQPLEALVDPDLLPHRIGATLSTLFGALALFLAAIGLYGVLAYIVAERTREIGVRRSLGAQRSHVIGFVIRRTMVPVALGLAAGAAAALAGSRVLASLLYDVPPRDLIAFTTAALVLLTVALLASYLPARRAARVDPMIALRAE